MYQRFQIKVEHESKPRRSLNAVLALATGVLTLIYPTFLYLIVGGYLMALGILFLAFRTPPVIAAFPMVTSILIFIFPDLIPVTFAVFLGFFGLILLLSFSFTVMGILTLIIAALIISNPDSIAYLIAAFLLMYSINNLIRLFQEGDTPKTGGDPNQVSIQ